MADSGSLENLSPEQAQQLRLGALLLKDPEVARAAKRLAKKVDPSLRIPEIELEDQIEARAKKQDDKIEELLARNIELEANRRRDAERAKSKDQGLDPDEVEARLVKENKEGNRMDLSTVRRIMLLERQTAEPGAGDVFHGGNPPHTPIEMRPDQDWRKLQGSALKRRSADIAHEMVNGFMKQRRIAPR